MQAHIVVTHPELRSFNVHLAHLTRSKLEALGWSVSVSNLYAIDFEPAEHVRHYPAWPQEDRFDVQACQRHASDGGGIPGVVADEVERLGRADLLILQYPMWWHLPPAMLKGWFDRVLIYGEVYASSRRFENGRFAGKRAMLSVTVGTSRDTYSFNGRSGDIDLLLWPVNFSLAYVGYTVLEPFIAYGVEAGLRYSSAEVLAERLKSIEDQFVHALEHLEQRPVISFNRMSEWQSDGRISPDARVHSPFIRHKKELELK